MQKKRPFSKLKKRIESLFDEKLDMKFCCVSYPVHGQWGQHNSIPRFYLKLGKEIIWDFPKDFEIKDLPFYYWAESNGITNLIREYIDTPASELLKKNFECETIDFSSFLNSEEHSGNYCIYYKITPLFKAADRRLGKDKLKEWSMKVKNPLVDRIIEQRFVL